MVIALQVNIKGEWMLFERCSLKREPEQEWNNRRIGAAKRALKREREKAGLFGEELMRFTSVEERKNQINQSSMDFVERMRKSDARLWREARQYFYALSNDTREEITQYWKRFGCPKRAVYFADLMTQLKRDPKHIKRLIGLASPYTRDIIINGQLHVIEISKEEHEQLTWGSIQSIDANKGKR